MRYAIFVVIDGKQAGPFNRAELKRGIASGRIGPESPARNKGDRKWVPLDALLDPISDAQYELLRKLSDDLLEDIPEDLSVARASKLISERMREHRWLLSDAQKRRLRFYGLPFDNAMSKHEATRLITERIEQFPWEEERYQKWKSNLPESDEFGEFEPRHLMSEPNARASPSPLPSDRSPSHRRGCATAAILLFVLFWIAAIAIVLLA